MVSENTYMRRCLFLANKAKGLTSPNPMVGCVIVHNNRIVGEGYHQKYGGDHAEIEAINQVKDKGILDECTLYVNMEPCSIHGNTPPCCDAIIAHKIPKVVIGYIDADSRVNGSGIQRLKEHGVEVIDEVLQAECIKLNKAFYTFHQEHRPRITLKWAQSKDGFISTVKTQTKISNSISDRLVHQWRAEHDAILIGTETARIDNPNLTTRLVPGKNPIRMLIDRNLEIDRESNIFNGESHTFVFNDIKNEEQENISLVKLDFDQPVIEQITNYCFDQRVLSVLVEGGAITLQYFIDQGFWDASRVITSSQMLGNGVQAPILNMVASSNYKLDQDLISLYTKSL